MKRLLAGVVIIERGLILFGIALLTLFGFAYLDRYLMNARMSEFGTTTQREAAEDRTAESSISGHGQSKAGGEAPKYSAVSAGGQQAHHRTLLAPVESLGILSIPAVGLQVPLLNGADELTLNRGVGRIPGTARPGEYGNIGIAGHRDSYFRRLKDIRRGDLIELATLRGSTFYRVDQIRITSPADVSVLQPGSMPSLTLVTCYPFYFVGPAPRRYVVAATLIQKLSNASNDQKIDF